MEYDDVLKALSRSKNRLAGLKQVLRAIEGGRAETVILADDADDHIRRRIKAQCQALGVPCLDGPVMTELGAHCRLDVGTAVACLISQAARDVGQADIGALPVIAEGSEQSQATRDVGQADIGASPVIAEGNEQHRPRQ